MGSVSAAVFIDRDVRPARSERWHGSWSPDGDQATEMANQVIIVDWGTSNFRAWLVDQQNGKVLDTIADGLGMASLAPAQFPAYCADRLGGWRHGGTPPVYMAGMVGAARGWAHAPQLPLPLKPTDLAARLMAVPGMQNAWIVPGARVAGDVVQGVVPDVMRGEEVQIFGAMQLSGRRSGLLCLPGTHSKWARVTADMLVHFTTSMTGEVYTLLMEHSLLGRDATGQRIPDPVQGSAFARGLGQSTTPGGLLHQLFTTRALFLEQQLGEVEIAGYLSGVLVGSEVAAMKAVYPPAQDRALLLVCSELLRRPYEYALVQAGYAPRWIAASDASLTGVREIIRLHGGEHGG